MNAKQKKRPRNSFQVVQQKNKTTNSTDIRNMIKLILCVARYESEIGNLLLHKVNL